MIADTTAIIIDMVKITTLLLEIFLFSFPLPNIIRCKLQESKNKHSKTIFTIRFVVKSDIKFSVFRAITSIIKPTIVPMMLIIVCFFIII